MPPKFDDPELETLYRNLLGAGAAPAPGTRPTPANMPRRIQRPQTAADIARAEGLDLGPLSPHRTRHRPARPARRVPARQLVIDRLLEAHVPRPQAPALASSWLRALSSPHLICAWITAVGPYHHETAAELACHGFTTGALETPLDGATARRRLRDGEPLGQVAARLLAHEQPR
ncbi:hypothetical protein ACFWGM_35630 [Streptomyces roseolus]|uniref:hypothetical protein n=1 Tax=Streptomyces roseolus TaxID=67358 RepID=UPI0036315FA6